MRRIIALATLATIAGLGAVSAATRLPGPKDPVIAATCSGSGVCTACKNCRACKNCAVLGGKCSVCR